MAGTKDECLLEACDLKVTVEVEAGEGVEVVEVVEAPSRSCG